MAKTNYVVGGLDLGSGGLKGVFYYLKNREPVIEQIIKPTWIKKGAFSLSSSGQSEKSNGTRITIADEIWTVGCPTKVGNTVGIPRLTDNSRTAGMDFLLQEQGIPNENTVCIFTLAIPTALYFKKAGVDIVPNKELINDVKQSIFNSNYNIKADALRVLPEAMGPYIEHTTDEHGYPQNECLDSIYALDVGFNSFDIARLVPNLDGEFFVDREHCTSIDNKGVGGALSVLNKLIIASYAELGVPITNKLSVPQIRYILNHGKISIKGELLECVNSITEAKSTQVTEIYDTVWPILNEMPYEKALLAGGGVPFFGELINDTLFPNLVKMEQISAASGLCKDAMVTMHNMALDASGKDNMSYGQALRYLEKQ